MELNDQYRAVDASVELQSREVASRESFDASRASSSAGMDFSRLVDLRVRDDGHAFDAKTGKSYLLNPTGLCALKMLQEGESVSSAAMRLASMYKQHPSIAEAAMRAFSESLGRRLA
jgi:hypothetical protein